MYDLEPERVLYDGIDRDLFPEYDKAVELMIEGEPNRSGIIPDQKKTERFIKWYSKGPVYAGIWSSILWGLPFSLMMTYLMGVSANLFTSVVYLEFLGLSLLGGFLLGYVMWYIIVKQTQKALSDYVAYYEKTQAQPSPVTVAYQSNQPQISSDDKYAQLDKISQLKERGVLTEQEFEIEKRKILK